MYDEIRNVSHTQGLNIFSEGLSRILDTEMKNMSEVASFSAITKAQIIDDLIFSLTGTLLTDESFILSFNSTGKNSTDSLEYIINLTIKNHFTNLKVLNEKQISKIEDLTRLNTNLKNLKSLKK